jgi:hypothetical protein
MALALPALAGSTLFCCNDERGRQVCGDPLPQSCYGRAYREINERGITVRSVAAPLTPEQLAERRAEEKRRAEAEAVAAEQKRRDLALLNTYSSLRDIDAVRERAEGDVRQAIAEAEKKLVEAQKERARLQNESEFYRKKGLPPELEKQIKVNEADLLAQQGLVDAKKKELDSLRLKYNEDKRNYIEAQRRQPGLR